MAITRMAVFSYAITPRQANTDRSSGSTLSCDLRLSSGSVPPAGSTFSSATISISSVKTWGATALSVGGYGYMSLDSYSTSHAVDANLNASDLINFTGGSLDITVSYGKINFREGCTVTLTVYYTITSVSTGALDKIAVNQNGTISITITAADEDFAHLVVWSSSSGQQKSEQLTSSHSASLTVPDDWSTGRATVTVYTYTDASFSSAGYIGGYVYSFTVDVDGAKVKPSVGTFDVDLVQSPSIPTGWGVFVKGYSKAWLTLTNADPGDYGAVWRSTSFKCGSQVLPGTSEMSLYTERLSETGRIKCSASVTNSFGNSAEAEKYIQVYDYASPKIIDPVVYRCLESGTANDKGTYLCIQLRTSFSPVDNKNRIISIQAQYRPTKENPGDMDAPWSTAEAIRDGNTKNIIGKGKITEDREYQVRIVIFDEVQNLEGTYTSAETTTNASSHVLFFLDGGHNVSIGMEGTIEYALQLNPNWGFYIGKDRVDDKWPIARGGTGATSAADALANLGAAAASHTHTYSDVGAAAASHTHTYNEVGAAAANHRHNASDIDGLSVDFPYVFDFGDASINTTWNYVYFHTAFSNPPYITATYASQGAVEGGDWGSIKIRNITTSGFEVTIGGSASTSYWRPIQWVAIGTGSSGGYG